MSFYRRAKSAFNALRTAIPRTPIHESAPRITRTPSIYSSNHSRVSGFSLIPSQIGAKAGYPNLFPRGGTRRWYYVDRYGVQHFKPRGPKRWIQNPRTLLIIAMVGSGALITVYFGNLETVPYTNRSHFVLLSRSMERKLGESQFDQLKANFKGKILSPFHPDSVRVMLISNDIIKALQRGFSHETVWRDPGYAEGDYTMDEANNRETVAALMEPFPAKGLKDEEILDDKWVYQSRKEAQKRGSQPTTQHLEGLNWEVLVVNEPIVNAFCLPGGKIVVFTGLLKHFTTDAEIATIIGHEVGHAVARHAAEGMTKNLWFVILQLILYQFIMPDVVHAMSTLLLRHPFSRRMEMEADYIGLLLMASAGYDPRIAPRVYEKLGKVTGGDSVLRDYLSTHPSGRKRAQLLAQAKVMDEAMTLFREARAGRGIEGFL